MSYEFVGHNGLWKYRREAWPKSHTNKNMLFNTATISPLSLRIMYLFLTGNGHLGV